MVLSSTPLNRSRSLWLPGWLFTSGLIGLLAAKHFVTEGMFGDGLCYAAIARNLAAGQGSFWAPFYSTSFWLPYNRDMSAFYEHPPLMFGLQALFFRLFGDHLWTEKIYSALVLLLTIGLLAQLWQQVLPAAHPLRSWSWLPVALWYSFPFVRWWASQNMLDTTMSLFCLLTVWFTLRGMTERRSGRVWLWGGAAALALLAAFLTKGPVSLHVLAGPTLFGLLGMRPIPFRRISQWTVGLTAGFGLLLGGLLVYEPARHNLQSYFNQQLWAVLTNQRETATSRFLLLQVLLQNVWPVVIAGLALTLLRLRAKAVIANADFLQRSSGFWMLLGLCVLLPMLASKKQYEHYLIPAFPYFALGLAIWLGTNLLALLARFAHWSYYGPALLAVGCLLWLSASVLTWRTVGTVRPQDKMALGDVHRIGEQVPRQMPLGVFPDLMKYFPLHPYLQRYYRIDLAPINTHPRYAMLIWPGRRSQADSLLAAGYRPLNVPMYQFALFERQP